MSVMNLASWKTNLSGEFRFPFQRLLQACPARMGEELESVHAVLEKYLPQEELDRVNRILLGNKLQ